MQKILDLIKKVLPKSVLKKIRPLVHGFLAYLAACRYGFPSSKMIVIGVTGTAGKSSTIQMLAHILNANSVKCGYSTTVGFSDGVREEVNRQGLSMPGRFSLQGYLRRMLKAGCRCALVECTSEGLAQNRHLGINFDIAAITNLSQAHLDSHGGIGNYYKAKARLFAALQKASRKKIFGKKNILANMDDPAGDLAGPFKADAKFGISFGSIAARAFAPGKIYKVSDINSAAETGFKVDGVPFVLNLPGEFNARNAAFSAALADMLGIGLDKSSRALETFSGIAGRMQFVPNVNQLKIIVDYAPEPVDLENSLRGVQRVPHNRIIHVFGSTGGHRDIGKRFEFGALSARGADTIIMTNDDVYDSDPDKIIADIREGINSVPENEKRAKEILRCRTARAP